MLHIYLSISTSVTKYIRCLVPVVLAFNCLRLGQLVSIAPRYTYIYVQYMFQTNVYEYQSNDNSVCTIQNTKAIPK